MAQELAGRARNTVLRHNIDASRRRRTTPCEPAPRRLPMPGPRAPGPQGPRAANAPDSLQSAVGEGIGGTFLEKKQEGGVCD